MVIHLDEKDKQWLEGILRSELARILNPSYHTTLRVKQELLQDLKTKCFLWGYRKLSEEIHEYIKELNK